MSSADPTKVRTDQNDLYTLQVKSEYILADRSSALPPLPVVQADDDDDDDNDREKNEKWSNRKKKNRGTNKKRPRDARIGNADKVCHSVIKGVPCPYGKDKCRYNHDMREILANRPPDIREVEGGCPHFNLTGYCTFGVMCRVGSSHVNMATGENLRKNIPVEQHPKPVMNSVTKELQFQLRKNTYPFKCKRHFEVKGGGRHRGGNKKKVKGDNSDHNNDKKNDGEEQGMSATDLEQQPRDGEENVKTPAVLTEPSVIENNGGAKTEPIQQKATHANSKKETSAVDTRTTAEVEENGIVAPAARMTPVDHAPLPTKRKLIDFRNKVYIAPLTTVGTLPFRRIMKRFGADITCGEMAVATNLLEGKSSEWALLKRHPEEDVFGVQIAAGFADQFTRACELLEAETVVDFVDLNLGCPIDLICNKGAGAALMLRDKKFKLCLEGISGALTCPFTVKMRTGWDESKPIAHQLVPKIQGWGIDGLAAIMIHGRSRLQRYSKHADWDYMEQVSKSQNPDLPQIPIIGNGDVFSYADYEEKVAREGLSTTAMLARGALIKPWLPTEIKERRHWDISASERLDMLKEYVKFGLEHWGSDQQGVNNTRRFLLEWLSFLYRYVPVGMLEVLPQQMNQRPPTYMCGRNDLETLMLSKHCADWIKISEMLLGPVPEGFRFEPKHKANAYK